MIPGKGPTITFKGSCNHPCNDLHHLTSIAVHPGEIRGQISLFTVCSTISIAYQPPKEAGGFCFFLGLF